MNYEEMSDFEINKTVCLALGYDVSGVTESINQMTDAVKDYCNSPSDAWPIIVDNEIGVTPHGEKCMANNFNPSNVGSYQVQTMSYDKNPLRAAMIVFLMMKENQNEQ